MTEKDATPGYHEDSLDNAIDFDTIMVSRVTLPYRREPYTRLYFKDERLSGYEVTVIADTKPLDLAGEQDEGNRMVTIVGRFPRCILSEVNTHRVFSRNSASSRARSVKTTIASVMNDPYIPLFTKNVKGMSGPFVSGKEYDKAVREWLKARDRAVLSELSLLTGRDGLCVDDWESILDDYYRNGYLKDDAPSYPDGFLNIHKQNSNRLIEPFMWHEAVITSDKWDNFINLRADSSKAQPEIYAFARLVEAALKTSVPVKTWIHVPFSDDDASYTTLGEVCDKNTGLFSESFRRMALLSATNCAKISYVDRTSFNASTASVELAERLLQSGHMSPFEHVAIYSEKLRDTMCFNDKNRDICSLSGNFSRNWIQLRRLLEEGLFS